MYCPIQLTEKISEENNFLEQFSLNVQQNFDIEDFSVCDESNLFNEAVFTNGRITLAPIVTHVGKLKAHLESLIGTHEGTMNKYRADYNNAPGGKKPVFSDENKKALFNPQIFWKSPLFKEMENLLQKTFGFRNVEVHPWIEGYISSEKMFESQIISASVGHLPRYPIDALVTDKGFYDKTHSLNLDLSVSLGLLRELTSEEITAVLLHEFGHGIDPALVDIKYAKINVLSKYLTDRQSELTNAEKASVQKTNLGPEFVILGTVISFMMITGLFSFIWAKIKDLFRNNEDRMERIRNIVRKDSTFNRQNYGEAYADNFARMYGFGSELASGLYKIGKNTDTRINSRIKKEKERQRIILSILEDSIKSEHRTDIHRVRSLLREYETDLKDPNIPITTKKQIKEDKEELEKILDKYLNSFSEFQNQVNRMINEELIKLEQREAL